MAEEAPDLENMEYMLSLMAADDVRFLLIYTF